MERGSRRAVAGLSVLRGVGSPRFCVSQARECARGLSRCNGTVEVLSSSWTPSLSGRVVVRLRERRQWDSDLLWWFGWSPQFFGFTSIVELQLDLSSVTARLRVVVLPVEDCHGVGIVLVEVSVEVELCSVGVVWLASEARSLGNALPGLPLVWLEEVLCQTCTTSSSASRVVRACAPSGYAPAAAAPAVVVVAAPAVAPTTTPVVVATTTTLRDATTATLAVVSVVAAAATTVAVIINLRLSTNRAQLSTDDEVVIGLQNQSIVASAPRSDSDSAITILDNEIVIPLQSDATIGTVLGHRVVVAQATGLWSWRARLVHGEAVVVLLHAWTTSPRGRRMGTTLGPPWPGWIACPKSQEGRPTGGSRNFIQ
ncbi:hypothetical protein Taro_009936 [Colocasia esculenta]|uniref:Uncharacterized protein n=1 Tax=Colocasia esculenta TaxID=4460 RepID=A0A843U1U7_COLES|nr:hypothetical protein [Colocasia esculenta]